MISTDIKLYDTLLNLDLKDLQKLCSTNRLMENICSIDNFWHQKTLQDFGHVPNINNRPWKSIYINEYEQLEAIKCIRNQIDHDSYDLIVLSEDLVTLMGLKEPIYTGELFKKWWYNYIDRHNLSEDGKIYPDQLMMDAFGFSESPRQRFVNRLRFANYSITFKLFDSILDKTITNSHTIPTINAHIAQILCQERKRLYKWL